MSGNADDTEDQVAPGLGARLRQARQLARMNQRDLGVALGYNNENPAAIVSAWEREKEIPTLKVRKRIAHQLGVSYAWLFTGSGPMTGQQEPGRGEGPHMGVGNMRTIEDLIGVVRGINSRMNDVEDKLDRILNALTDGEATTRPQRGRGTL